MCFYKTNVLTSSVRAAGRTANLQRRTGWQWRTDWGHPGTRLQTGWYRGDWGGRGWKPLCRTCPHLTLSSTCWLDSCRQEQKIRTADHLSVSSNRGDTTVRHFFVSVVGEKEIPFYGDNFVSAFASVDSPKGAWVCNKYAHQYYYQICKHISWKGKQRGMDLPEPIISLNSSSGSWRWKWDGRLALRTRTSAFSEKTV